MKVAAKKVATGATAAVASSAQPRSSTDVAGFSADWLGQREPFDAAARDAAASDLGLDARLAALRPKGTNSAAAATEPWRVIDLACGTGANMRWLAPRLGGRQQWLVADHDPELLQSWPEHLARVGTAATRRVAKKSALAETLHHSSPHFQAAIVRQQVDLAASLAQLPWASAHLVTASALLDLVSAAWLQQLVQHAAAARVALLLALSVDGRHGWSVPDKLDDTVAALFAAHQQRDKGFAGPAQGAAAAPALALALRAVGYRVFSARSDWHLDGSANAQSLALQRALIAGMGAVACEQQPAACAAVQAWQQRRHALAARSTLVVGHIDLLALPPRLTPGADLRQRQRRQLKVSAFKSAFKSAVKSRSHNMSSPSARRRAGGRGQSAMRVAPGHCKPGRPLPISTGAMTRCKRSSIPAAKQRDTVTPPPSTNSKRSPRAARAAHTRAGLKPFAGSSAFSRSSTASTSAAL